MGGWEAWKLGSWELGSLIDVGRNGCLLYPTCASLLPGLPAFQLSSPYYL
jgi:hypothetical protein